MKDTDKSGEVMCYVGKAPCGCYRYAAVIEAIPRVDMAKDIEKMLRSGWGIEQKTAQWVRDGGLNFHCDHQKQRFTRRQRDVIPLIAKNLSNKEIAQSLGIEEQTAKNLIHGLIKKLGAKDRQDIVTISTGKL